MLFLGGGLCILAAAACVGGRAPQELQFGATLVGALGQLAGGLAMLALRRQYDAKGALVVEADRLRAELGWLRRAPGAEIAPAQAQAGGDSKRVLTESELLEGGGTVKVVAAVTTRLQRICDAVGGDQPESSALRRALGGIARDLEAAVISDLSKALKDLEPGETKGLNATEWENVVSRLPASLEIELRFEDFSGGDQLIEWPAALRAIRDALGIRSLQLQLQSAIDSSSVGGASVPAPTALGRAPSLEQKAPKNNTEGKKVSGF